MPILPGTEEAVSNSNYKYKGELGLDQVALQREAAISNFALLDREATGHWSAMNKIREGNTSRSLLSFAQEDVGEAMAQQQMRTGNSVAETNANVGLTTTLVATLAQVLAKAAQTTPPYTAWPFPPQEAPKP